MQRTKLKPTKNFHTNTETGMKRSGVKRIAPILGICNPKTRPKIFYLKSKTLIYNASFQGFLGVVVLRNIAFRDLGK